MKTLEQTLEINHILLKDNTCLVDIETTGVLKSQHIIFCIGIIYYTPKGLLLKQWLAESLSDEVFLLKAFMIEIVRFTHLITYNGKSFDIPFILARLAHHGVDSSYLVQLPILDLKYFNMLKSLSQGKPLNRNFLENCLNIKRHSTTTGKELLKLFAAYISSPDILYEQIFLTHNLDDLLSSYYFYELYYIFSQLSYSDLQKSHLAEAPYTLILNAPYAFNTSGRVVHTNVTLEWHQASSSVTLTITPELLILRRYLTPAKDYVLIPSQHQIIHKSVAKFIPAELKQKVSKENCYIEKQSYFIQLINESDTDQELWLDAKHIPYLECISYTSQNLWTYCKKLLTPRITK